MAALISCPKCASATVTFREQHARYDCDRCGHQFVVQQPPSPLRIFLSYGHDPNEELVRRIKADLEARGHDVWFDKSAIKFSDDWRRAITDGIVDSHRVLSFLSRHSTRDPGVCLDEIAIAIGVKGGNIQTILVESELEVMTPPSITHLQWLDMHDWKERRATDEAAWDKWYQDKFAQIVSVVESEESRKFAGEISTLQKYLKPVSSESRIFELLQNNVMGREWVANAIKQWRTGDPESRLFWILGSPGFGKSAFAAWFTHYGRDKVIAVQFCEYDKPDHRRGDSIVRTIAFQMAARLPEYRKLLRDLPDIAELDRKNASELFEYLLAGPLRYTIDAGRERVLIVIDALDEAGENGRNELVEVLARNVARLPDWIGIVVTSRPEQDVTAPLQALNPFKLDTAVEENRADIRAFVWHRLGPQLSTHPNADALLAQILDRSEGMFLYAVWFCRGVQDGQLSLDRPDDFPQGLGGVFWQFFDRQFRDMQSYGDKVRPALSAITAAREPLPLMTLQALFNWSEEKLRDFTRLLGSQFPVSKVHATDVIKPHHKFLGDWLADESKAGRFFASVAEGHRLLADYGRQHWREDRYALAHLPQHLLACHRLNEAADLLADASYVAARVAAGREFELAREIGTVFEGLPAGDSRRQGLQTMLADQTRSEQAGMARMTTECLTQIAETAPTEVSAIIVALVEQPQRGTDSTIVNANIRTARVALEVAVATCHHNSMSDTIRRVVLAACAVADSNIRSLGVVAVFRLMHENANYDLGLSILEELARRSVRWGFIRPRALEAFAGCSMALFFERNDDPKLGADLKRLACDAIRRLWWLKLAVLFGPTIVEALWLSVPKDSVPINTKELVGYKEYAKSHPEVVQSVDELIEFLDPAHGTSQRFAECLSRFEAAAVLPDANMSFCASSAAWTSRALAGDESVLEAVYESRRRLPPDHFLHQDFLFWIRVVQIGYQNTHRSLSRDWTERIEDNIRQFLKDQQGIIRGIEQDYVIGGIPSGFAFLAQQQGRGQLPLIEELVQWSCGNGAEMLRWPDKPRDRQPDLLLMRTLEIMGVELGSQSPLSRQAALFGIKCFLKHRAKFDDHAWNLLATALARMNIYRGNEVAQFLNELRSEDREALHARMSRIVPQEGVGTLLANFESIWTVLLSSPSTNRIGLRKEWQKFLHEYLSARSLATTLRRGVRQLLQLIQHGAQ